MALPEYGRNVLKMIEHVKTIKDPEERNQAARTIIQIMGNLNPNLKEVTDFRHKLWDHLMIIADFDLDVDSPYPAALMVIAFARFMKDLNLRAPPEANSRYATGQGRARISNGPLIEITADC